MPRARKRVLVTRAGDQAQALTAALREIGVEPVTVSTIEIIPPASFAELDQAIAELDRVDYLILTSVNAVNAFFDRLTALGHDKQELTALRTVAVGPKSAQAIAAYGIAVDLTPQDYRAEGIVALLKERVSGKRVLYPKAALARDLIPAQLTAAGAEVIDPVAYASAAPADAAEKLHQALACGLDLLTFTASSTLQNFVALLDSEALALARRIPIASIGPLTSTAAEKLGFKVVVEPDNATIDALVEAIDSYFSTTRDGAAETC